MKKLPNAEKMEIGNTRRLKLIDKSVALQGSENYEEE